MILHRYINRQVFITTVVVTFILVMVLISGKFIRYLAEAAAGEIAADVLFQLIAFRLPEFLQMLVPLSLYVAVLLSLGRMYMDNEMVVLQAGGQGHGRIVRSLMLPLFMATCLIAAFSLYVTPRGDAEVNRIFEQQKDRSVLELLTPGRFQSKGSGDSQRVTYAEHLNRKDGVLENVFVADASFQPEGEADRLLTVWAKSGKIVQDNGISYLLLSNGFQYQGRPGSSDYKQITFREARVRIGSDKSDSKPPEVRGRPTSELIAERSHNNEALAELEWRISLILSVPIIGLAAIPLARVNPRQGRFYRLIPAVIGYLGYVGMLLVCRSSINDSPAGAVPWYLNMAWVHLIALVAVMLLYLGPSLRRRRVR